MNGLFWGLHQHQRIGQAEAAAGKGMSRAARAQAAVKELEDRVEKLALVCMAMWSLLQEQTGINEEELAQRVQEIDLQDGQADGKVKRQVKRCPKCNHVMSSRHARCLYCGATDLTATPFDPVL